jgi:hypothetical protein
MKQYMTTIHTGHIFDRVIGQSGKKEEVESIKNLTKTNNFAIICHPKKSNATSVILSLCLQKKHQIYFSIYNNYLLFKKTTTLW